VTTHRKAALRGGLWRFRGQPSAAILLLHGGQDKSLDPTAFTQPAVLRMLDMYVGLRRSSRRTAVYQLRYGVRGWNADPTGAAEPAPVVDARWALDQISDRHPGVKIALLGYSMGGRTAFAVADDERVVGVCGLAPWLPEGEPVRTRRDSQRFVIAHGTSDRMTSAPASLQYAERLRESGEAVARFEVPGEGHALSHKPWLWHRFAVAVSLGLAGDAPMPGGVAAALEDAGADTLRLPLGRSSYR
jgi:predicted alpha/beta-hydrolase family hydrolase